MSALPQDAHALVTQEQRLIFNTRQGFPAAPVMVVCDHGADGIEGTIVKGTLLETGDWDLDGVFWVAVEHGDVIRVKGWGVAVEVL